MENSNFTNEQIDDYIMGLFDEKAKKSFEAAFASNSELGQRLQERRELIQGVEAYHAKLFKDKLKKIHKKAFAEETVRPTAKRRSLVPWLVAAASVAVLVIAFFLMRETGPQADQLYANNFSVHELGLIQRNDADQRKVELEDLYDEGNYNAAIPIFDDLLTVENKNAALLLGAGIAKMETGDIDAAIAHFDSILANGDILYKDHAHWYKALALLKNNNIDQSKKILKVLIEDKGADHYQQAIDLLKDMEAL